jgi:hypothetical protein
MVMIRAKRPAATLAEKQVGGQQNREQEDLAADLGGAGHGNISLMSGGA